MKRKFKVGDKVVWADEFYRGHFFPSCPPDAILTVVGYDGDPTWECVLLKGPDQMDVEAFEERFKLYKEDREGGYVGKESFELVEQASEERGMSLKYKVGDVVVLGQNVGVDCSETFTPGVVVKITELCCLDKPGEHYTVERIDGAGSRWWVHDHEIATAISNGVEQAPQTSNEKPSYLSFFTSVIVAKNKDVSDIGEMLYDENTTKISLEDEGGGAFLIVEQDYNGAIQQIRLDIDEADAIFSAIKQLVKQLEGK